MTFSPILSHDLYLARRAARHGHLVGGPSQFGRTEAVQEDPRRQPRRDRDAHPSRWLRVGADDCRHLFSRGKRAIGRVQCIARPTVASSRHAAARSSCGRVSEDDPDVLSAAVPRRSDRCICMAVYECNRTASRRTDTRRTRASSSALARAPSARTWTLTASSTSRSRTASTRSTPGTDCSRSGPTSRPPSRSRASRSSGRRSSSCRRSATRRARARSPRAWASRSCRARTTR